MRLIDADSLMRDTESSMLDNTHKDEKVKMNHHNEHSHFLSLITKQPTVNNWIPVNERLPDVYEKCEDVFDIDTLAVVDTKWHMCSDLVLITVMDLDKEETFVCDDCIVDGKWSNFCSDCFDVIAWQPLPPKYNITK